MARMVNRPTMGAVLQGDIWWCEFPAPDKPQPVLLLTRSQMLDHLERVTVAPLTTNIRGVPTEVLLTLADGLDRTCAVTLDNIQTVSKEKLRDYVASLSIERMRELRAAIEYAFRLDLIQ